MALLHSRDVCHKDLSTNNMTLALSAELSFRAGDLFKLIRAPKTAPVETLSGAPPEPHVPRYAVDTLDFRMAPVKLLSTEPRIFYFI